MYFLTFNKIFGTVSIIQNIIDFLFAHKKSRKWLAIVHEINT